MSVYLIYSRFVIAGKLKPAGMKDSVSYAAKYQWTRGLSANHSLGPRSDLARLSWLILAKVHVWRHLLKNYKIVNWQINTANI